MERPEIREHGCSQEFLQYYYLKDEMVSFLRDNNLPVSGSKDALKCRIAAFLDNSAMLPDSPLARFEPGTSPDTHPSRPVRDTKAFCPSRAASGASSENKVSCAVPDNKLSVPVHEASVIDDGAPIGACFVCSEAAREYFVSRLGKTFSFKVAFQKWLRNNPEAAFSDACSAYRRIVAEEKDRRRQGLATRIEPQFEYNAYVRAFFADNPGSTLSDAIKCWNYKKSIPGSHEYDVEDVAVLGMKY